MFNRNVINTMDVPEARDRYEISTEENKNMQLSYNLKQVWVPKPG